MKRLIVVLLASLFVLMIVAHFAPSISHTAFVAPSHRFEDGSHVGGFGVTWTMLLGAAVFYGLWKLNKK